MRKTNGGVQYPNAHPKVICLSGSTRFAEEFNRIAIRETLLGHIVLRPEVVEYDPETDIQHTDLDTKELVDGVYFRKIEMADELLVVNLDGYIGESTSREISYARYLGTPIRYEF